MSIQTLRPAFATFRPRPSPDSAVAAAGLSAEAGLRIDVLRRVADVEAIAAAWRALEVLTPEATGFQSADWCLAWMAASRNDSDRWRIVTVRDAGHLVCVMPLECGQFAGARILHWLGEPWTQYGDAIVANDGSRFRHLSAAWREIAAWRDIDLIKLGRMRADAALTVLPGFTGRTVIASDNAPFADLGVPPMREDKRLRARRRRLQAMGPVRFEIVTKAPDRHDSVRLAIGWKQRWLQRRGLHSSGLSHPALAGLMDGLAETDGLVIGRLCVGDAVAALEMGLVANGCFRSLLGAHDEAFSQGSPGHLLIGEMIASCRENGLSTYDLMLPSDDYKRRWATAEMRVQDHLIVRRWRGALAATWFRARPTVKRAYAQLPARLRRAGSGERA